MARVFQATYRTSDGQRRTARRWYVEFRDACGVLHRMAAFADRRATEEFARKLDRLIELRTVGELPSAELRSWLETLPETWRRRLAGDTTRQGGRRRSPEPVRVLDTRLAMAGKPLDEHVNDYARALADRGNTQSHIDLTVQRIRTILAGIGANTFADVTADAVAHYLADRRRNGLSIASSNHYLTAIKCFCRWLVRARRIAESPVTGLAKLNEKTDVRRRRRALEPDELRRLLAVTATQPPRYGMTGPERAALYRLAVETGLRAGELRSLTPKSFDLTASPPCLTVQAAHSKHRRDDTLPLRSDTAQELRSFLTGKPAGACVFRVPGHTHTAKMFRADLEAAGVPYVDEGGRYADFHSLRHTFVTNLVAGGVHPKVAQHLARHSTIALTMDRYTHVYRGELSDALAVLPDLSTKSVTNAALATGTDNVAAGADESLVVLLARKGTKRDNPMQDFAVSSQRPSVDARKEKPPKTFGKTHVFEGSRRFSKREADGSRTRNHRIDSPVL